MWHLVQNQQSVINHFLVDGFIDPYCNRNTRTTVKTRSDVKDLLCKILALPKPALKLLWHSVGVQGITLKILCSCLSWWWLLCFLAQRSPECTEKALLSNAVANPQKQQTSFSSSAEQRGINGAHFENKSNRSMVPVITLDLPACPLWGFCFTCWRSGRGCREKKLFGEYIPA